MVAFHAVVEALAALVVVHEVLVVVGTLEDVEPKELVDEDPLIKVDRPRLLHTAGERRRGNIEEITRQRDPVETMVPVSMPERMRCS